MTTRLSQRKVKGSSIAYSSLYEEMQSRILGSGTDYVIPLGGIPRTDMTADVQQAIALAEKAYILPESGLPFADLDPSLQASIEKANASYEKPEGGIPVGDLSADLQYQFSQLKNFYQYPATGIPYVDLDANLKEKIDAVETKYVLPEDGVPLSDLHPEVQQKLNDSLTRYTKPEGGIPLSDLAQEVVDKETFDETIEHIVRVQEEMSDDLNEISYTVMKSVVNQHSAVINQIEREVIDSRGDYSSLERRLDSAFFEWHDYTLEGLEIEEGTFNNLFSTPDHHIHFGYTKELFPVKFYRDGVIQDNFFLTEQKAETMNFFWQDDLFKINDVSYSRNVGIGVEGYIYAPVSGEYQFGIQATGSYQFSIHDQTATYDSSDNLVWDEMFSSRMLTLTLEAGQMYPMTIQGNNETEIGSRFRVVWKPPTMDTFEPMPYDYFSSTGYNLDPVGIYTTTLVDTEKMDIRKFRLQLVTDFEIPESYTEILYRHSEDRETFSEWKPLTLNEYIEGGLERYLQFHIKMTRGVTNKAPVIKGIVIDYLSNKNNVYHEWQEARQDYVSLRAHFNALHDQIKGVEELALAVDKSTVSTDWLQNIRFEHLDLNMLRLHWEQLKTTKGSAHILPSGFIEDFHNASLLETGSYKVENSKVIPTHTEISFDTTAQWSEWEMEQVSARNNELAVNYMNDVNGQLTATRWAVNQSSTGNYYSHQASGAYSDYYYQPFYVSPSDAKISFINVYVLMSSNGNSLNRIYADLLRMNDDGSIAQVYSLGYRMTNGWNRFDANIFIPPGSLKWKLRFRMYSSSSYYVRLYFQNSTTNIQKELMYDNPENKPMYMENANQVSLTNQFVTVQVQTESGVLSEGEAWKTIDVGYDTRFVHSIVDASGQEGFVEMLFSSSKDGVNFSEQKTKINEVPDGRYLHVWTRLSRLDENTSPVLKSLKIIHNRIDSTILLKPVRVTRVPTHIILDAVDSDPEHFDYYVSRDNGVTFKEVVLGIQTDVRDIAPGYDMVVKAVAKRGNLVPDMWIDYIGLQTITHEDFNDKQTLVALHQVVEAAEGQIDFNVDKSYMMGDHSLQVYVNGSYQIPMDSYDEVNEQKIRFRAPLKEGDKVILRIAAAAYQFESGEEIQQDLIKAREEFKVFLPIVADIEPRMTANEELDVAQNERLDALELTDAATGERMDELETDIGTVGENLSTAVAVIDQQITVIDSVVTGLSSTDETIMQQLALLQQTVESIKTDLEEVKTLMAIGTTDFENLQNRVSSIEGVVEEMQLTITAIHERLSSIDSLNAEQTGSIETLTGSVNRIDGTVSTNKTALEKKINDAISSLTAIITTVDKDSDDAEAELARRLADLEFIHPTDADRVNRDKLALLIDHLDEGLTENGIQIMNDVVLPTATQWDSTITWQSSHPEYITAAGKVTRPSFSTGDKPVFLTATIRYGLVSDTKVFTVNIKKKPISAEEKVAADKAALQIDDLDQNGSEVGVQILTDVLLPTTGSKYSSVITWASSNPAVLGNDGTVNRPTAIEGDAVITLTATITSGANADTKLFTVTVVANDPIPEPEPEPEPPVEEPEPPVEEEVPTEPDTGE